MNERWGDFLPNLEVKLPPEKARKILSLVEKIEADEDVQAVYHNLDPASLEE
ncbi:YebC/PmpR family DNA-binding transcriptional regulator [Mycoplasma sp. ATU-Cv-508]|uniref:YebC/PmpR family DNA-binding transcriptional regulator n=1 Tax=Mycoplasma sp. ATU-Cv-508 TaxID=2048001 RepID=UPI001F3CB4B4